MEALGSILLYVLFSLLAMVGAYLALASTRGRKAGLWGALATGIFLLALFCGLVALWRTVGASPP
jgi:hypothetical protein